MRSFEPVDQWAIKYNNINVHLPKRSTEQSAGYDFYCPVDALIEPHTQELIYTNVKAKMNADECLLLFSRSSLSKKGICLANGVAVIDSDFYNNQDNNGNIAFLFYNNSNTPYEFKIGDKIGQGIFVKYLLAENEDTSNFVTRSGGIGSTGVR